MTFTAYLATVCKTGYREEAFALKGLHEWIESRRYKQWIIVHFMDRWMKILRTVKTQRRWNERPRASRKDRVSSNKNQSLGIPFLQLLLRDLGVSTFCLRQYLSIVGYSNSFFPLTISFRTSTKFNPQYNYVMFPVSYCDLILIRQPQTRGLYLRSCLKSQSYTSCVLKHVKKKKQQNNFRRVSPSYCTFFFFLNRPNKT